MKMNKTFQNVHIKYINSDFSVDISLNATRSLGDVPCSTLDGICLRILIKVLVNFQSYVENL